MKSAITCIRSSLETFLCPGETTPEHVFYLAPYDGYAKPNPKAGNLSISNITCALKAKRPYASTTRLFNVDVISSITSSSNIVPNETVAAADFVFSSATTCWGNAVTDSIFTIRMTNPSLSLTQIP